MKKYLLQNKFLILYSLFVLIIAFLPFFSQTSQQVYLSPFNGFEQFTFSNLFSAWVPVDLGMYSLNFTPQLAYAFLLYKLFPAFFANTLLYGSIKVVAGFSIYLFLGIFTKNNVSRILGSFFYLLSLYGQAIVLNAPAGGYLFYAFLPLLMYVFVELQGKNFAKYTFFSLIIYLFLIDTNAAYIAYFFLLLGIYALVVDVAQKRIYKLVHVVYFVFLFLIATLGYYLPLISTIFLFKSHLLAANLAAESAGWKSSYTSVTEVLRMMGSLDFQNKIQGVYAKPFFQYFISNKIVVVLCYLLVGFALIGILFGKIKKYPFLKVVNVVVLLIFLFFSFGANVSNPLVDLYSYGSHAIPMFAAFRDAYKSVSIINFIYTIGITLMLLLIVNKQFPRWIVLIYIGALCITSWPFFLGNIFTQSELLRVPLYWDDIATWNNQEDVHNEYKLLLPSINFPIYTFTNMRGKTTTFVDNIFDDYIIRPIGGSVYQNQMEELLSLYSHPQFERILGYYGISYIINQKDIDYTFYNSQNPFTVSQILQERQKTFKTFGDKKQIEIYQIPKEFVHPIIYIPHHVVLSSSVAFTKENLTTIFSQNPNNDFLFMQSNNGISLGEDKNTTVEVKEISTHEYRMVFHNVSEKFPVVFNQQFDEGWVIKDTSWGRIIPLNHFVANGIMNGFVIDPRDIKKYGIKAFEKKNDGNIVTLTLYFEPQQYMYIGYFLTTIALIASLLFFLYPQVRKKVRL